MKKWYITIGVLLSLALGWIVIFNMDEDINSRIPVKNLRICPEAWVENDMPLIGDNSVQDRYFIVENQRFEYEALDVEWVKENCLVKEPIRVF